MTVVSRCRRLAAAIMITLCAGCTATDHPGATRTAEAGYTALLPLFRALEAIDSGTSPAPVAILQIGDSHTANDGFSGRMRGRFQDRFGNAGRGMLPPGIPFKYYHPAAVTVTATGWRTIGSLDRINAGPFGISGVRQSAAGKAEMTLIADDPDGLDSVTIEALGQNRGGTIDIIAQSGETATLRTASPAQGPLWLTLPARGGVTLRTRGDGPVDMLSWTATRNRPGVTWSNMGTISATIDLPGRWDPGIIRAELARLQPELILIAFGTNEGFNDATDPAAYEIRYAERVRAIQAAALGSAILTMGPPDGTRHAPADGAQTCVAPTGGEKAWIVPPRLPELRAAQRRIAQQQGWYFWDWSAAMGGACSIVQWAKTDPAKAAADHVHLLKPGYRATADVLFDDLMRGYTAYRAGTHQH